MAAHPNPDIPDEVFDSIVQTIASGWTVQAALDDHMVKRYDYDKALKNPLKAEQHRRARQAGVDAMADDVPHIADNEPDAQRARNRIEARKWLAGVIKPREYGARLDLVVTPGADPRQLHDEGLRRARLMRDLQPLALPQVIEEAELIVDGSTDGQSVAAPSIFD
jgi:hypothetical protein